MDLIKHVESSQLKSDAENFRIGDTVRVHFKIVEGKSERVQIYEGTVIAKNNGGIQRSFTVRKLSFGVGVEKVFPLHSPRLERVELVQAGRIRRAKLYYLRDRVGKATKVRQLVTKKSAKHTK
ncbi:50S ribosomal protein L19 [Entomospira entomophila]|uniref:Large ribosomal subunit protein bL19 n=1 Tax=Entomospira entomophila TaxID=2719988 RepID=A0A968GCU0_9SPIO|nr:50S ribosomal protein L19 [Entomospira entomophilus]NIZ41096.1 50S ribosomal protein L19 [Entomospira entomophilus]WDI35305.1 50S ribosomal protein L19 [Entomospira entomophilus]